VTILHRVLAHLRWLFRRRDVEDALERDLQDYIERSAASKVQDGTPADQAYRQARIEVGGVEQTKERVRATLAFGPLEALSRDIRYALRTMRSQKSFTAVAVLCLALGIGANTTIFSFLNAILLRSLPVTEPGSLVFLQWTLPQTILDDTPVGFATVMTEEPPGVRSSVLPYPALVHFRARDDVFASVFGSRPVNGVQIDDAGTLADGSFVTGDFFRGLGVGAIAGRTLIEDDDRFGARPVIVLAADFSRTRFGMPDAAVGQIVRLNGVIFTVVGVTPPSFFGVDPARSPDFFIPLHSGALLDPTGIPGTSPDLLARADGYMITVAARLRPRVNAGQAESILRPYFDAYVAESVKGDEQRLHVTPTLSIQPGAGGLDGLRSRLRDPILVLFSMVALILVIACANIASLLLSRATARRREIAVRLALGAGRGSVVRQLLTESIVLSLLGGVLGVIASLWGVPVLTALLANGDDSFVLRADVDWQVLAFTLVVSIATGVLFGLAPALHATRVDVFLALKAWRRIGLESWRYRRVFLPSFGQSLVVAQIALSLVLLVAAGLFARSLSNLRTTDLGFNKEGLLLADVGAQAARFTDEETKTFWAALRGRLLQVPGVKDVSMSWSALAGGGAYVRPVSIPGTAISEQEINVQVIGEGFFRTMQIAILAGRPISDAEVVNRRAVAVVDRRFAEAYFPGIDPIGRTIVVEGEGQLEVVGVSTPARHDVVKGDVRPVVYYTYTWDPHPLFNLVFELRTLGVPLSYANAVRAAVRELNPDVRVTALRTQVTNIDRTINPDIVLARLSNTFSVLALLIACVGLYGTVGYSMARRTQEMGIRIALGAQRAWLLALALRQVLGLAAAGLLIGVPAALLASRYIESLLWGVDSRDPATLAGAAALAVTAVALAGFLPASRASRIDPTVALRSE
jgi:predicted permease